VDEPHPPRHVELGAVVLRHPDPAGAAPPPAPPGRLLTWAAGASAGFILLVGVCVVYVLAATTGAHAPKPDAATGAPAPVASAVPVRSGGGEPPGPCPATVRPDQETDVRPPADGLTGVTVCRYRFPKGGAGTRVGAPVAGRPEDFLRAVRGYRARATCRPAAPPTDTVVVDAVHLVYGDTTVTVWLPRLPCEQGAAGGDPAAGLRTAVDALLGPPR